MNLQQLEETLPNGFHDARLLRISARFDRAELQLDLDLSVGDPDAPSPDERDAYTRAVLQLSGLAAISIDPPRHIQVDAISPLNIDAGCGSPPGHHDPFPRIPAGCFKHWF